MNTKYLSSSLNDFKRVIFILSVMFCITAFKICSGQSIVGKWNQLKIKTFYTAAGAAANGNQSESVINMSDIGTAIFVFYSNKK
jgi:hypothetical protein